MNKTYNSKRITLRRKTVKKGGGIFSSKPILPASPKNNTPTKNIIPSPKLPIIPPGPRPTLNIKPTKFNFNPAYLAKRKYIINKIIKEEQYTKKNNKNKGRFIYPRNEYPVNKYGKMSMSYFPVNNIGFNRNKTKKVE